MATDGDAEPRLRYMTARWCFAVTVTSDDLDGGFIAYVAELPGVMSQGDTEVEAVSNLSEAFADMLFEWLLGAARPNGGNSRISSVATELMPHEGTRSPTAEHRHPAGPQCQA